MTYAVTVKQDNTEVAWVGASDEHSIYAEQILLPDQIMVVQIDESYPPVYVSTGRLPIPEGFYPVPRWVFFLCHLRHVRIWIGREKQ